MFRIFGLCDKSSLVYITTCTGLHNIKAIVEKKHCSLIDNLISDVCYSNVLLVYGFKFVYSVCVYVSLFSGCIYCEINYIKDALLDLRNNDTIEIANPLKQFDHAQISLVKSSYLTAYKITDRPKHRQLSVKLFL